MTHLLWKRFNTILIDYGPMRMPFILLITKSIAHYQLLKNGYIEYKKLQSLRLIRASIQNASIFLSSYEILLVSQWLLGCYLDWFPSPAPYISTIFDLFR